jgi:hypothetical protein
MFYAHILSSASISMGERNHSLSTPFVSLENILRMLCDPSIWLFRPAIEPAVEMAGLTPPTPSTPVVEMAAFANSK